MMRSVLRLWGNADGAVAPMIALSLTALIAVGGLAFDYAHLAAMDTELQDAADHAALAGATQLDGEDGARARATQAAEQLITNETRFARRDATHDGTVGIAQVTFYVDESLTTVADTDQVANFVKVQVDTRAADYALTPIVGAMFGELNAKAVAGLSSAVCGVVPFFICNPEEPPTNTDPHLDPSGVDTGVGMVMAQGGSQWGPGNFGFLDQVGVGANGVAEALASDSLFGNCSPTTGVTTETGNILNAVRDSLNMRMDFLSNNASACKNPPCSPSTNVVKDVVKGATGCSWTVPSMLSTDLTSDTPPRYFPRKNGASFILPSSVNPQTMGYPRDLCHYYMTSGQNPTYPLCSLGRVGNGSWDRDAYFRVNHPGLNYATTDGLGANVSRYQTYLWEASNPANMPGSKTVGGNTQYPDPQNSCLAPGLAPDPNGTDRRRITAAVVNCHAEGSNLNGKKKLDVAGFIDVFIVEPSIARKRCDNCGNNNATFTLSGDAHSYLNSYGSINDIYVEVIGASGTGQGGVLPQITRRDVPRLIE